MVNEEKATKAAAKRHEAYIIKFDNAPGLNGYQRMIEWINGHGVLDRRAIAGKRSDLCDPKTLKWKVAHDVVGENARYWADRGATVEGCTDKEAEAYRTKLLKDPKGHLPRPKPEPKAEKVEKASGGSAGKTPPHKRGGGGGR